MLRDIINKDTITKNTPKSVFIKSIKSKISSKLRVDGLDTMRQDAIDNYYDENNDEILEVSFDHLFINEDTNFRTIENEKTFNYVRGKIIYNVTQDTWSFNLMDRTDYNWVDAKDLPVEVLKILDDNIVDIEVAYQKDKQELDRLTIMFPVGQIFKSKNKRKGVGKYTPYYIVVKAPVRKDYGVFIFDAVKILHDGTLSEVCNNIIIKDEFVQASPSEVITYINEYNQEQLDIIKEYIDEQKESVIQLQKQIVECQENIKDRSQELIEREKTNINIVETLNKSLYDSKR